MLVDTHMHTYLCGHAFGEPEEYVTTAAEKGIDLITFTCHIPMRSESFGQAGIRMQFDEIPNYFELVQKAADFGKELGVQVLRGIEAEVFPDENELTEMDSLLKKHHFDFVLGSLHAHCNSYIDWLKQRRVRKDEHIIDCYFRHLRDGVESGRYDSMSHPDVIRTYGVVSSYNPRQHEDVIREFLQAAVDEDTCIEVNTGCLMRGAGHMHPDPLVLDWASEMGNKLTLGSDSHQPDCVGGHFEGVVPMLKSKGFDRIHYFINRERKEVTI